jgi:hypothetical protein
MSNDNPDYNVGKVLEVSETWAGSEVTQDYASGSTVLEVYSTLDYSDQGGDVIIDGVVYPYNTKNEDDSTISLASALTVGISQDEEVLIYPLAKLKEAMVQIDDEDADLIRVPQSLYDALPFGIRLPADQETVLVSAYGDSEILDIVNQELLRDGSYIDGSTLPASGSDGLPPGPVGVVTIHGGIEMLFLSWDAVPDAEVVTYDVYIDTVAGFTPGPTNLAGSTDATVFNINLAPGTYYAQVIARDSDGPAAPSAEVSDTVIASVDVAAIQAQVDANAAAVKERPRVIFAATQPTLTTDEKAVWYDTSNGYAASYWDGTAWGPYSLGTGAIAANAVTSNLLASNAVTTAKIAANAVTTAQIVADAVTAAQIATGAVTSSELANGAVIAGKIGALAITAAEIAASAITTAKIAADAVTAGEIASGAVGSGELAAGAVIAGKITAGTIAAGDIAAGAITTAKIAALAVTANEIAAGTITAAKITTDTITATQIAAGAISSSELATGAVIAGKITAGTIAAGDIATGAITAGKIAADAVTATEIAASSVGASEIVANSITASQIASLAITTAELAADSVVSAKIAAGTIVASDVATDTLTASQIAASAITTTELASGAVTAVKITAGSITANEIAAGTITATQIAAGTITATQIAAGTITASQLSATAIDGKTITGAIFQTQSGGERIVIRNDGSGGIIEGYSGVSGESLPSVFDPSTVAGLGGTSPQVMIASGTTSSFVAQSKINLLTGSYSGGYIRYLAGFHAFNVYRTDGTSYTGVQIGGDLATYMLDVSGPIRQSASGGAANSFINSVTTNNNIVAQNGITADNAGSGGGFVDGTYVGGGSSGASINNNGRITRTSTIKMKKNIKPMTKTEAHSVLGLESYTFEFKQDKYDRFPDPRRYPGFIAEQAAKEGAELWVARQHDVARHRKTGEAKKITRNKQGKPIAFRTAEITVAHNKLIKELFEELESLKAEVASLK